MDPFIIVNPKSGKGLTEQKWASLAGIVRNYLGPFEVEFTKASGHASQIAEREAKNGRRFIVSFGGDGTISEVATGLLRAGSDVELGVLPWGTGGDFRRTIDIPRDFDKAARLLSEGKTRVMDVGRLHYINNRGDDDFRFYVNTASFGISGEVARRANESSKRFGGALTYMGATIRTLTSCDFPEVFLQFDDQEPFRMKVILACVNNGPCFGGGMKIAPDAKLNDGLLDAVVVRNMKMLTILRKAYHLYDGSVLSLDEVLMHRVHKAKAWPVQQGAEILLEVDGESPGRLPATFEVQAASLRIRC